MYKSIMICNHEKTPAVIRNAMMKHGLEGSPENYTLAQVLPESGKNFDANIELRNPCNASVINNTHLLFQS